MTTKTDDIKLPLPSPDYRHSVPRGWDVDYVHAWSEASMRGYGQDCARAAVKPYVERINDLEAENTELEHLCDETFVAQGADAYNHACEVMEHWQAEREKHGKVVGTTGSLCDGIAWLYNYIDDLEADRQGRMPSDESINGLWRECTQAWNKGKTETPLVQQFARALLSRYSSGQPAVDPAFVSDLERSRAKYPENARMFDGLMGEIDELRRAYAGDGNVRAEAFDVAVCAYRIATEGDTGGNTLLGQPAASAEQSESAVLLDALSGLVKALRERHHGRMPDEVQAAYDKAWSIVFSSPVAAPVAQEPVAWMTLDGRVASDETKRNSMATPSREAFCIPLGRINTAEAQPNNASLIEWVVSRWNAEVAQRPLNNRHRRSLDDVWRQVLQRLGADDKILLGPAHDDLFAAEKHGCHGGDGSTARES